MKKVIVLIMCFIMVFSVSIVSFAGDKQLELDKTSIEDGSKDVPLLPEFNLVFTNNVINMKVKDNNMSEIKMISANGDSVDLEIVMADDQIAPEEKRNVTVKVKSELEKNKDYTLIIGKNFSGKNGTVLKQDVEINFTTEGGKSSFIAIVGGLIVIMLVGFTAINKNKKSNA